MNERAWWSFRIVTGAGAPGSIAHVPAETELQARTVLERNQYEGAPVDAYPCLGSRFTTRERLG
jgi:hypothetical protein